MLLAVLAFASCDNSGTETPKTDFSSLLQAATNEVIVKTYQSLDDKTALLVASLTALETGQTAPNLESARQAWRDSRKPWEQSEGFLFGPVDSQGIDPAMDSWPVNEIDLDAVLASGDALTKPYIDAQEGTIKGFHTLEYLLFGQNGQKTVANFTPREFEYLRACAESLRGETSKLVNSWLPTGSNFSKNLLKAGTTESIYPSQKAAVEELVQGIIGIADEVANGKIQDPFVQQNVVLEESRFSANSKADFADNIRSMRNIYFGSTTGSANSGSLNAMISLKNPTLDAEMVSRMEAAIQAIENIPGTFTTAIFDQKPAVEAAQKAVRDLLDTVQGKLLPYIPQL